MLKNQVIYKGLAITSASPMAGHDFDGLGLGVA
jgi:hypothetical protein